MDRVQRNTGATAAATFYEDGVAVDPGTVTLNVTRLDGTTLVTGGSTSGSGTSARTFALTAATHTTLLDTLRLDWISATKGTLTTIVEIVGGFLFSLADARAITPLDSTSTYSTADLLTTRTAVEQAVEQACGVAFVSRYAFERYSGDGSNTLQLRHPLPSSIRSASIAGTALTAPQLAALTLGLSGAVYSLPCWTWGQNNIVVGYEHGYQEPPMEIRRAAVLLAKMWLVGRRNPIDDRAITFNAGADGGTYSLAVPGRNGSSFGHPDIDVAIDRYSRVSMVA